MQFEVGKFGVDNIYTEWWALLITILVVAAIVALIVVAISLSDKSFKFETRDLTYAAVCVAIAFALSFFGFTMAYGGTITFMSTLPIMIYCYYFGFRKGLIICTVYMMLQFLQNPYIISPWSALFDYIFPYMALCFVGLFSHNAQKAKKEGTEYSIKSHVSFFIGAGSYIVVRYLSHVLSGILFFAEYKWANWPLVPYSLAYNTFVLVDFAIAMIAAVSLLISRSFNSFMLRNMVNSSRQNDSTVE